MNKISENEPLIPTRCKDCIYFILDYCISWNRPTIPSGYCHKAETEGTQNE